MKPTKAHIICYLLLARPATRREVMRQVHAVEGKADADFRVATNNCYWRLTQSNVGGEGRQSVLVRGLVKKAGKRGREILYTLTVSGKKLAREYKRFPV